MKFPPGELQTQPWYAQPSVLYFGDARILSVVGPQQGDPMAGLLFCLAFRALHRKVGLITNGGASALPKGVGIASFFFDEY